MMFINNSYSSAPMYGQTANEQSYIENILRLDHIILSDPNSGNWYLLLLIYVDYIKFDENINTSDQFYPSN